MNFASDTVLSESTNFMDLGLSSVDTTDEIGTVFDPTTIIGLATHGSNWLPRNYRISEATADRVRRTESKHSSNLKSVFETRRDKVVDQYFGRQNDYMSRPHLESTSMGRPPLDSPLLGTNTNNGKKSPIDLIPVGTKTLDPTPLTRPTELIEQNGKAHVPGDPDPDPSSSYSSSKKI